MSDKATVQPSTDSGPAAGASAGLPHDTRRAFVERLARTTALPMVLPLLFVRGDAAAAY